MSAKWTEWNWRTYCFHFCLCVCVSICEHSYLDANISKTAWDRLRPNYPLIGNGLWRIEWWRHRWCHVTFKGQGRDPNIIKARYFENGSRYRLGCNGHHLPPQPSIKAVKKIHLADICTLWAPSSYSMKLSSEHTLNNNKITLADNENKKPSCC